MDISHLRERASAEPISVSALNQCVKTLLENAPMLTGVSVRGEISNLTVHTSGHLYFTLKDEEAQIRAVMFRSAAMRLRFAPENGMKVIVTGSVAVYLKELADKLPPGFKAKGDIFVFVDECHRTQGGVMNLAMKKIMGDKLHYLAAGSCIQLRTSWLWMPADCQVSNDGIECLLALVLLWKVN